MTVTDRTDSTTAKDLADRTVRRRYRRSPFCLLYWEGHSLVIVNCNRFRMFRGAERYANLLHELSDWTSVAELRERAGSALGDESALHKALERLVRMDLVIEYPPQPGDEFPPESRWNLIDLAMHRQIAYGGYDEAQLHGPPPPAFKDVAAIESVDLPAPALDDAISLRSVLDRRRSLRSYSDDDVSLETLATFLGASARVTETRRDSVVGEYSRRPYPSGGARHPLEIYAVCNAVSGMTAGAWHYDPRRHRLNLVKWADEGQARLNAEARAAAGDIPRRDPPVVVVVTAVFNRTMWKYERIGLSLILREVGALYQTMHLVATALDLAGCPLGAGREYETACWLGLDPLLESPVGTFLLGPARAASPMNEREKGRVAFGGPREGNT